MNVHRNAGVRITALAILLCLCLGVLVGCGSSQTGVSGNSTGTGAGEGTSESAAKPASSESAVGTQSAGPASFKVGMLTMLGSEKEKAAEYTKAQNCTSSLLTEEGYCTMLVPELADSDATVYYYETLETMLMGLNAGEIDVLQTYQTIGKYLCAMNDSVVLAQEYDLEKERNTFAQATLGGILSNDFSFLMMADHEALRDEFDEALLAMKEDGTLDRIREEQITNLMNGGEIHAVPIKQIEGAETIRVAVTGSMPPMDYAAPDGSPAGFSTAVMAEISQRIGKNIALLVVDSVGRAVALSSGAADVAFWTRTNVESNQYASMDPKERLQKHNELIAGMTQEEALVMDKVERSADYVGYGMLDIPTGTIITEPYFTDIIVPVMMKSAVEVRK